MCWSTPPGRIRSCSATSLPARRTACALLDTRTGQCGVVPGQSPDEWYEHEFWSADGTRVCFHGGWHNQPERAFCGWYEPDSGRRQTFVHVTPGRGYAHYNLHPGGRAMVTDGEAHPGCISKVHLRAGQQVFEVPLPARP